MASDECTDARGGTFKVCAVVVGASRKRLRMSSARSGVLVRALTRTAVVLGLAWCVGACHKGSFPPLASVRFDASRAGESVSIPVTITPDNANIHNVYMVGFYIKDGSLHGPADQLRGSPPKARLYLRVRIFRQVKGSEIPVDVNDYDFDYDIRTDTYTFLPSMCERGTDIAYVSSSGQLRDVAHMQVVSFRFPDYGRYRIEVSTVSDMPILGAVPTWLTVEREFPHGK